MSDEKKFVYIPVIQNIIESLERERKYLPEDLGKFITFTSVEKKELRKLEVPYKLYANELYQSIAKIYSVGGSFIPFLFEEVVKMQNKVNIDTLNCSYHLQLFTKDNTIYFNHRELYLEHNAWKEIYDDLKMLGCRFAIIGTSIKPEPRVTGHYNIIFVEQIGDVFIFNFYEPLGKIKKPVVKFLKELSETSNGRIVINKELYRDFGVQKYAKDDIGYCVMFSLFWVYMVLNIVVYNLNNNSYKPSTEWISNVERYYGSMMNSKQMFDIVITFSITLFNNFIADLEPTMRKETLKRLHEKMMNRIRKNIKSLKLPLRKKANYVKNLEEDNSYSNKELKELSKVNPEITYESWVKAEKEEEAKMRQVWEQFLHDRELDESVVYKAKLKIGSNCKTDQDCFSNKCKRSEDPENLENPEGESYCIP